MLLKQLGATSVQIPEIGMGTWQYHAGPEPLRRGLEAGARFIDTAESYGSETVVAEAIAGQRDQVFLATKVSRQNLRHQDVLQAADRSLSQLRTDHIDLYQIHEPSDSVPLEETMGAMEELVDAGKVRFVGVSNFSVARLRCAQRAMKKYPLVSNQVRFNLADRTIIKELLPYCQANHVTVIAYSPLARHWQHLIDSDPQGVLRRLAGVTGHTPVQIALNWCLCQNSVVVIPKSNLTAHILENCGASGWRLTPEQLHELDRAISFRSRSSLEIVLRRYLPPGFKGWIRNLARLSPRALRRRLE